MSTRAVVAGLVTGALLLMGNLTVGLASGFWDSGQISASLISFALASIFSPAAGSARGFTRLENDTAQMIACATAAMPAAMGLLGAIPALQELGLDLRPQMLLLLLFGISLALLGAGLAFLLAPRLLDEEQLPFPTGVAAAELISALHSDGGEARRRTRALFIAFVATAIWVALRDLEGVIPGNIFLPLAIGGLGAEALGLGFALSPMLWGVGIVTGMRTGVSLLLGGVIGWAIVGTQLISRGLVRDVAGLPGWLVWPGSALLIGATAIDLLGQARSLFASIADLRSSAREQFTRFSAPALSLALVALICAHQLIGVSYPAGILALLLFAPLCAMVARAAGQTDFSPTSQAGQLTQAAASAFSIGAPLADIGAGAIVAGGASQTSTILWSMRTGRLLGARTVTQLRAALIGITFGGLVSIPAYLILLRAWPLGSKRNPAPSASEWRAFAEVVTHGLGALPHGVSTASAICLVLGALLALGGRGRFARYLPSPVALGIGFLIAPASSASMLFGAVAALIFAKLKPASAPQLVPSIAGGMIAAESLLVFSIGALTALGVLH